MLTRALLIIWISWIVQCMNEYHLNQRTSFFLFDSLKVVVNEGEKTENNRFKENHSEK